MNTKSTAALVTVVAATQSAGCYSTFDVQPDSLRSLHGFGVAQTIPERTVERQHPTDPTRKIRVILPARDPDEKKYYLTTKENEAIQFDKSSTLLFVGKDRLRLSSRFEEIKVKDDVLLGLERDTKVPVYVDLNQVYAVQATVRSPGKTGLLALGVASATVLTGGFLLVLGGLGAGGRPLRVPGQTQVETAPIFMRKKPHSQKHAPNDVMRARAFAYWSKEAAAECASVPAFMALARDLARTSAPTNLVRAALRAAKEEVDHTRLCLGLAERHGDSILNAMLPAVPDSVDENASVLLERLVLEAFWDGCVAEGGAAAIARRNAGQARDASTRLALQTIARDETEHARLAETILAYGLATDRRRIGRVLRESFEMRQDVEEARLEALRGAPDTGDVDGEAVREMGLAQNDTIGAANVEAWERSVALLSRMGV